MTFPKMSILYLVIISRGVATVARYEHKAVPTRALVAATGADGRAGAALTEHATAVLAFHIEVGGACVTGEDGALQLGFISAAAWVVWMDGRKKNDGKVLR